MSILLIWNTTVGKFSDYCRKLVDYTVFENRKWPYSDEYKPKTNSQSHFQKKCYIQSHMTWSSKNIYINIRAKISKTILHIFICFCPLFGSCIIIYLFNWTLVFLQIVAEFINIHILPPFFLTPILNIISFWPSANEINI